MRAELRAPAFVLLALALALSWPGTALALLGDRDEAFGVDGSLRTVTAATRNYDYVLLFGEDNPSDGISQSLLRLELGGRPSGWWSYEVHGVQGLGFSTAAGSGGGMAAAGSMLSSSGSAAMAIRYRSLDESQQWAEDDQVQTSLWLDRCNIKLSLPWADLIIGRQAITFGKAYFWNPLDVFLAFDPRAFDRDYKAGVDALRVDIPLGDFSGLSLVGVAGRSIGSTGEHEDGAGAVHASWEGSAVLGRIYGNLLGWDLGLQGGKVYGGYQLGGALAGELGALELRAEAAWFFASGRGARLTLTPPEPRRTDHLSAVVGVGRRFDSGLILELEYLYNGAGDPEHLLAAAQRTSSSDALHMGRNIAGLSASYEILPILRGQLAWIFSFSDMSTMVQPGILLSVADEADFLAGAMIAFGDRPNAEGLQSEFGTYPDVLYMEFKLYF